MKTSGSSLPSDRSLGALFTAVFALLTAMRWYRNGLTPLVWALAVAALIFALLALFRPASLRPLNWAWMRLADLLGKIVSPLVLGAIFFVLITPYALIARLGGRDPLRLKRRQVSSYWLERDPPGPTPDSLRNQY